MTSSLAFSLLKNKSVVRSKMERRAALVYDKDSSSLRNDAAELTKILAPLGYEVKHFQKATRSEYKDAFKYLVSGAKKHHHRFFYSGSHGFQVDGNERDGKDECIATTDGRKIRDTKVREDLVMALPKGCILNAFVTACHSGTIADMEHNWRYSGDTREYRDDNYPDENADICFFTACQDDESTWSRNWNGTKHTDLIGGFLTQVDHMTTYKDLLHGIQGQYDARKSGSTAQLACHPKNRISEKVDF